MDRIIEILGLDYSWERMAIIAGLILIRLLIMISLIPFLFGKPVPNMVKMGSAMAIMLFIYPVVSPTVPPEIFDDGLFVLLLFIKEFFYGMALGLSGGMIFYGFDAAGQVIDNQRGGIDGTDLQSHARSAGDDLRTV